MGQEHGVGLAVLPLSLAPEFNARSLHDLYMYTVEHVHSPTGEMGAGEEICLSGRSISLSKYWGQDVFCFKYLFWNWLCQWWVRMSLRQWKFLFLPFCLKFPPSHSPYWNALFPTIKAVSSNRLFTDLPIIIIQVLVHK